jgi:acetate kinase
MNLLILRSGDASLSYRLMPQPKGLPVVSGEIRRIGPDAEHIYSYPRGRGEGATDAATFDEAVACMAALLQDVEVKPGETAEGVDTIAHLFPTGGTTPVPVTRADDGLIAAISVAGGAPGNRGALEALDACRGRYPSAQHVVVWDDAFYSDLPPESRRYLLPESFELPFDLHRCGYRGLLHGAAVSRIAPHLFAQEQPRRAGHRSPRPSAEGTRIVLCFFDRHAGVTAVLGNAPVWTTFGVAPGDGLPGASGVGSLPVGALETILKHTALPPDRLLAVLRNGAGLGLREPEELERVALEAFRGVEPSRTTFAAFIREIVGAIGAAATILGGIDALVFVGDRALASHRFRAAVCSGLDAWKIESPAEVPVPPFEITPLCGGGDHPFVYAVSINEDELVARDVDRFLRGDDAPPAPDAASEPAGS